MEIIKINTDNGIETVSARELHNFLESKRDFPTWFKDRIEKYGFIEGQDFTTISGKSKIGRPSIEYYISLDMAKELSMVENNDKGRQARQYFIEVEKKVKNIEYVTKSELKEIMNDQRLFLQALLEQQNNFMEKMINNNYQKQLPEPVKYTVKEYLKINNITAYNITAFRNSVGRIASSTARELNRSIQYVMEDDYSVGSYDEDILNHAVNIAKIKDSKQIDLF